MSYRPEHDRANDADFARERAAAAATEARDAFSQEALEFARGRQDKSPARAEATEKISGATPRCFAGPAGDRESQSSAGNDVIRTFKYPDGTTITDHANGDSIKTSPEGSKVTTRKDGTMTFQDRDGNVGMVIAKDGTVTQFDHKKGTKTTEYPDGRVIIEERNGRRTRLNRGFRRRAKGW